MSQRQNNQSSKLNSLAESLKIDPQVNFTLSTDKEPEEGDQTVQSIAKNRKMKIRRAQSRLYADQVIIAEDMTEMGNTSPDVQVRGNAKG